MTSNGTSVNIMPTLELPFSKCQIPILFNSVKVQKRHSKLRLEDALKAKGKSAKFNEGIKQVSLFWICFGVSAVENIQRQQFTSQTNLINPALLMYLYSFVLFSSRCTSLIQIQIQIQIQVYKSDKDLEDN